MQQSSHRISSHEILSIRALHYRFPNQVQLFEDLSFSVLRGERVALLGANGAGKSTLFRILLGLIPIVSGEIVWQIETGPTPSSISNSNRSKQRVAFIPQQHGLSLRLSVLSNVIHGRLSRGWAIRRSYQMFASRVDRAEAAEMIRKVGLEHKTLQPCQDLSGGESQRVALARALFAQPEVVIADEPAASLDPSIALDMMELLTTETKQSGCTVLFATHSLSHAFRFSDRLLVLKAGRIVLDCSTHLCTEDEVWKHYG
jgi:phosphonate transport system ATP-binding protein